MASTVLIVYYMVTVVWWVAIDFIIYSEDYVDHYDEDEFFDEA